MHVLRRNLRRLLEGLLEVVVRHLLVMLGGDRDAVADPLADDVDGETLGKLCFPGGAKILE
jgi:hypothetical protein